MSRNQPRNRLIQILLVLTIIFIAFGDQFTFLPKDARQASIKSRTFVMGLWPKWLRPRNTNEQREQQVEDLDKGGQKK